MIKKLATPTIIGISLLYALSGPIVRPQVELLLLALGLIVLVSALSRNYVDLFIAGFVVINLLAHRLLYPDMIFYRHIAQTTALCAFTLLQVSLCMGPLAKFSKRFSHLLIHRRHIGVSVFMLALTHALFVTANYYKFDLRLLYGVGPNIFGTTALFILTPLAGTSINYFKTKVKVETYNLIHTGLLLFYFLYIGVLYFFGFLSLLPWQILAFGIFMVVWVLFAPWSLPKRLFLRVNGWKQLHYLVYIAYISVFLHAWTGFFYYQKLPMQIVFWLGTLCVVTLHTVGWIRKLQTKRQVGSITDSLKKPS